MGLLGQRQRQIVSMVTMPNAAIATELGISPYTVKNTLKAVKHKLGVRTPYASRGELLLEAMRRGELALEDVR